MSVFTKFNRGIRLAAAAIVLTTVASGAHAVSVVSVNSYDNGWYKSNGSHVTSNTNIISGQSGWNSYRNFFAFDLSGVTGRVVSATLSIAGGNGKFSNMSNLAKFAVYDVSTKTSSLTSGTGGTAAFADLGSGSLYGSTAVATPGWTGTMPTVSVALANAIGDINNALGNQFALGGTTSGGYLWGYSNGAQAATLSLTVAAVPVPAALPLMLLALGGMGVVARRRKTA